jgi:hypothetical protein
LSETESPHEENTMDMDEDVCPQPVGIPGPVGVQGPNHFILDFPYGHRVSAGPGLERDPTIQSGPDDPEDPFSEF